MALDAAQASKTVDSIVGGLVSVPILLVVAVINMAYIGTATWFLLKQEGYRHEERVVLADLLKACMIPAAQHR